jgi:hypothetical protein
MRGWVVAALVTSCAPAARKRDIFRSANEPGPVRPVIGEVIVKEIARADCHGEDLVLDEYEVEWLCGERLLRTSLVTGVTGSWIDGVFTRSLARDGDRTIAIRNQREIVALASHSSVAPKLLYQAPTPVLALATHHGDILFAQSDGSIARLRDDGTLSTLGALASPYFLAVNEYAIAFASRSAVTVLSADATSPRTFNPGLIEQMAIVGTRLFVGAGDIDLTTNAMRSLSAKPCLFVADERVVFASCWQSIFAGVNDQWARLATRNVSFWSEAPQSTRLALGEKQLCWLEPLGTQTAILCLDRPAAFR